MTARSDWDFESAVTGEVVDEVGSEMEIRCLVGETAVGEYSSTFLPGSGCREDGLGCCSCDLLRSATVEPCSVRAIDELGE